MNKRKAAALEKALRQIEQLQASQPAGLLTMKPFSDRRLRCKSIEKERPEDVYRSQCPYVGVLVLL